MTEKAMKSKEATMVGRINNMLDAGYQREEIMKTLGISEVTFRAYLKIINDAKRRKAQKIANERVVALSKELADGIVYGKEVKAIIDEEYEKIGVDLTWEVSDLSMFDYYPETQN